MCTFNKSGAMLFFFTVSNNRNFSIESERKSSDFTHNVKIIAMKSLIIPVLSAIVLMSSCSVYRSGQTPDDVYYSPARQEKAAEYVEANSDRNDGKRYDDRDSYSGYDAYASPEDRWLMMRVRNRARWSAFDDYYYSPYYSPFSSPYYSPYSSFGYGGWGGFAPGLSLGFGFYSGGYGGYYDPYGSPYYDHFNNYWNWNNYYNPYYRNIIVINPKMNPAGYTRSRNFNLNSYSNTSYGNRGSVGGRQGYNYRPRYSNTNSNSTLGGSVRRVFSNSNSDQQRPRANYSSPEQNRPVRSYSPSNSSNSTYSPSPSSGSSNSGGGGSSGSSSGSRPSRR
jgi:hypothetical protein